MIDTFGEILVELGKKYKNLLVFGVGNAKEIGVNKFAEIFNERYFNLGQGVSNAVCTACGTSVCGKIPMIVGFADVLVGKAFGQIKNNICEQNLNVKIVAISGTPQDLNLFSNLENLKTFEFQNPEEMKKILECLLLEYGPSLLSIKKSTITGRFSSKE